MTPLCQAANAAVSPPPSAETLSLVQYIHSNKEASKSGGIPQKMVEKVRESDEKKRRKGHLEERERRRLILLDSLREGQRVGQISSTDVSKVAGCCWASKIWFPSACRPCAEARRVGVNPNHCSFPLCPHFQHQRATRLHAVIAPIVSETLEQGKSLKLITLTIPNCDSLNEGQVHSIIRKSLTRMRHRKAFRTQCGGGAYGIETTHEGHGYHVHLHVLVECDWWDQAEISREWFACLTLEWRARINQVQPASHRGRAIVYIQEADARVAHEFCKYIAKGSSFIRDPYVIAEYLRSTKGRRLFEAFGSWRGKVSKNRESHVGKIRESHLCPHGSPMICVGLRHQSAEENAQGFAYLDEPTCSFYKAACARKQQERAPPRANPFAEVQSDR